MTENDYERRNALNSAVKYADWLFNFRNDFYQDYLLLDRQTDIIYYIQAFDKQNILDTETMLFNESECRKAEKRFTNMNLKVTVWNFTVEELDNYLF